MYRPASCLLGILREVVTKAASGAPWEYLCLGVPSTPHMVIGFFSEAASAFQRHTSFDWFGPLIVLGRIKVVNVTP